jgi:hypothetical protein
MVELCKKEAGRLIENLKKLVQESTEEEAKSLLIHILLHLNMQEDTEGYSEKQVVENLHKTYKSFLEYKQKQSENEARNFKAVHILSGPSAAGGFKMAMEEMRCDKEEKVISFSDIFSYGPLTDLHEETGQKERYEWLHNHINLDVEYEYSEVYFNDFKEAIIQIECIPPKMPITVWTGENAHEQSLLRFILFLLKEKDNEIFIINTTSLYKTLFDTEEYTYDLLHTGEISIDGWKKLYKKAKDVKPCSLERLKTYIEEWKTLDESKGVLRVWEGNSILDVEEGYYDDYIIKTAQRIQKKRKGFMKSARLIGEVIGHLEDYLGDSFVEYRVRNLVLNGVFEIKGVPKGMRFYSVRLRENTNRTGE